MSPHYQPDKFKNLEHARKEMLAREERLRVIRQQIKTLRYKSCAELGKKIKKLRVAAGLTQVKLADLVGTSQEAIAKIEAGRHNLTFKNLEKLAKALGKDLFVDFG